MSLPGLDELMQQAKDFNEKLARIREDLAKETVQATAGGGMVSVDANGQGRLLRVQIEPGVVDPNDIEMLQDLVVAAVNQALHKAKELAASKARALTGGLPIPGLDSLFT